MKWNRDLLKIALYYKYVVVSAESTRLLIMLVGYQGIYENLRQTGCALIPHLMNFSNPFILHFKDRVSKKDYPFQPLFTNFKKNGDLKFITAKTKRKTNKQRWVCHTAQAYKDDLAQVNNILESFLDAQDFPDGIKPL